MSASSSVSLYMAVGVTIQHAMPYGICWRYRSHTSSHAGASTPRDDSSSRYDRRSGLSPERRSSTSSAVTIV
jgi:hypothetical protein